MSLYNKRGVSAQKEEVHAATKGLDPGLYPYAFCKLYPDYLQGSNEYINIMHADGAGTKSILAYLYWKETGDISVWKDIAQDAIVMNLDDLLCVGIYDNIIFNSTIDRNKHRIPGQVLQKIISGTHQIFEDLRSSGINIHYLGGETADVGDIVRTVTVNGTMAARWPKNRIVTNEKIQPGDVIVGLASFGQATYENAYNSGIGSNGLTSARHDMLSSFYTENYKESFDDTLAADVVYIGKHRLADTVHGVETGGLNVGKLLLSPTRTFAPVLKILLENHFEKIHGLIHCSGGGQTKCLKYLPGNFRIIKDNLFPSPPVFQLIQQSSGSNLREMFEVFNMGCRMEVYCAEKDAGIFIETANSFNIDAKVIGRVETATGKSLLIKNGKEEIVYQ
jgi:phosphoribosylformylglycinamidine cyclo-ligase